MSETIAERLASRGIVVPDAVAPAANYVPYVIAGGLLYISGQLPIENGKIAVTGHLGGNVDLAAGQRGAELCALNLLAQAKAALDGDLERIVRVVRLTGFVASTPDFVSQHLVINSASSFFVEALGERGRHARVAVGMAALPMNAAVEVDAIIAVA